MSSKRKRKDSQKTVDQFRCITLQSAINLSAAGNDQGAKFITSAMDNDSILWLNRTVDDWARMLNIDGEIYVHRKTFRLGNRSIESVRNSEDYVHLTIEESKSDPRLLMRKLANS